MTKPTAPIGLDPHAPEDGLSYVRREILKLRLTGMTSRQCRLALGERLNNMEDVVELGLFRPVVTDVGVAAYAPTEKYGAYLAAGRRLWFDPGA